jgi:hypothetical protein
LTTVADAPEAFNGVAALGAAGLVVVGGKAVIIKTFQFKRKIKNSDLHPPFAAEAQAPAGC